MYSCNDCGTSFTRKCSFTRHKNERCVFRHRKNGTSASKLSVPGGDEPSHRNHGLENERMVNNESTDQQRRNKMQHSRESANYLHCNEELPSDESTGDEFSDESTGDESSDESRNDESFDISNYSWYDDGTIKKNHSFQLPRDIRAIIVGKSGSGKTTLLTSLLLKPDVLDYENLMVCGKSLHQPSYKIMQLGFDKGLSKTQIGKIFIRKDIVMEDGGPEKVIEDYSLTCKGGVNASFFDDVTMIPDPSEHESSCKNLLVLDDIMLGPQNKVEAYFTRGRHSNVDVIYITQSYFRLPRQTIRENGNLFMFFPQDRKNLIHIFNDHCAGDNISFSSFSNFCNDIWRESPHNFVTIDLSRTIDTGKYRKKLNYYGMCE